MRGLRWRIERRVVRRLLGLPEPVVRRLAGRPRTFRGHAMDPRVQLLIRLRRAARFPRIESLPVDEARRVFADGFALLEADPDPVAAVEALTIAGLRVRIYRPAAPGPVAALVYLHGGGNVIGSLDTVDGPCRAVVARVGCAVLSVDYRLAPEHPFPAAFDDAVAVFRGIAGRAAALGLDPARLAIGGDSAGANLATSASVALREDAVRPAFQLLIYPAVDYTMTSRSIAELTDDVMLDRQTIDWFRATHLAGADPRDPRCSPLFADDVAGSPPALLVTAGFDPLQDDGFAWAARLREAGVPVEHHHHPDLFHGFWNAAGVIPRAREARDRAIDALAHALRGA